MSAENRFANITTNTTTQVKGGNGVLKAIVLNKPVASSTITIYDNTGSDTSVPIGIITNTTDVKPYEMLYDLKFSTGLKIVTSGADNLTVVYR